MPKAPKGEAYKAPMGGLWGGVTPSLLGEGSGEGALPPPQPIFFNFGLKMVHFGAI